MGRDVDVVELDELVVGDEPEAWMGAGFTVDPDGVVRIGRVRIRLVGRAGGKRIRSWSLRGLPAGTSDIDGIATTVSEQPPCEPAEHANGALSIDHVVLLTPDMARTTATLEALGIELRRTREVDASQYGFPALQCFFRIGEPVLEVVGAAEPNGEGPAAFFGLAHTVADIDVLPAVYGPSLGRVKDAVQDGRRIATLRHKELDLSVATAFMSP
jgi:catechol 2,3-dioxygenase-like lactoylglutathione lyase family enzyme